MASDYLYTGARIGLSVTGITRQAVTGSLADLRVQLNNNMRALRTVDGRAVFSSVSVGGSDGGPLGLDDASRSFVIQAVVGCDFAHDVDCQSLILGMMRDLYLDWNPANLLWVQPFNNQPGGSTSELPPYNPYPSNDTNTWWGWDFSPAGTPPAAVPPGILNQLFSMFGGAQNTLILGAVVVGAFLILKD